MSIGKALAILLLTISINSFAQTSSVNIKKISAKVYIHESFLDTKEWGKVSCNGMIFINKGKALVFDTPANELAAKNLIHIIQDSLKATIIGVVINHFHEDCLGGLSVFHAISIPSYANQRTLFFAAAKGFEVPKKAFNKKLILNVGGDKVENYFFGAAHTRDNIVSYIPSEKTLFGGCMVKEIGASKGNLADADTREWANTVKKVSALNAKVVIPGHGKIGGPQLLDYTEQLFKLTK